MMVARVCYKHYAYVYWIKIVNPFGFGGTALSNLAEIQMADLDPRLQHVQIEVACDVNNPLCGERGASAIFWPTKKVQRLRW